MTKIGKRKAQRAAQSLLAQFGIKQEPVAVEKIAVLLGATVKYGEFDDELSGMVFIKDNVPVIGVNAKHHPFRQRYTIAHEIGHLTLHRHRIEQGIHVDKEYPVLRRDAASATGEVLMEIEANAFAAELLMPEALLEKYGANAVADIDDEEAVKALAKQFRVSASAMRYRLLGLLS